MVFYSSTVISETEGPTPLITKAVIGRDPEILLATSDPEDVPNLHTLWDQTSLLFSGYGGSFLGDKVAGA
jgi:hypothetical protein